MNVLGDATGSDLWKIIVDHMHDVGNIQTACRERSSNHDRTLGRSEGTTIQSVSKWISRGDWQSVSHGIFALTLSAAPVDRSARQTLVVQVVVDVVHIVPAVHEDQGPNRAHAHQEVIESLLLQVLINIDDLIHHDDVSSRPGIHRQESGLAC